MGRRPFIARLIGARGDLLMWLAIGLGRLAESLDGVSEALRQRAMRDLYVSTKTGAKAGEA